jgi:hypothetical protein
MEKYTLLHSTGDENLIQILKDGHIKSASALGINGTGGEDNSYVYMTVTNGNPELPVPYYNKHGVVFHFHFTKLITDFPDYFINEGNSFGPLNGSVHSYYGKSQNYKKKCMCRQTFRALGENNMPCSKKSVAEMLDALESLEAFNYDHCDGGPEIGFHAGNEGIPLKNYLLYVTVPFAMYNKHRDVLESHVASGIVRLPPTGGRTSKKKKTMRRRRGYRRKGTRKH